MKPERKKYDVVIVITKKDISLLETSIEYIRKNLDGNRYICLCSRELQEIVENVLHCVFLDEDAIFPQMTLEHIRKFFKEKGNNPQRAGWYFQQFLKMAYSYISETDQYLVWDSDTIPLSHIEYIRDGKYVFMGKKEYHEPYFEVIGKLFKGEVFRWNQEISFIAENMLINCLYMKEMINSIVSNKELIGDTFYEKILNVIDEKELPWSGFSEFETYGNYMMIKHPGIYDIVKRRALRIGAYIVGYHPQKEQLEWISKSYEIVSIENKARSRKGVIWQTWYSYLYKFSLIRKLISAKKAAQIGIRLLAIQSRCLGFKPVDYDI